MFKYIEKSIAFLYHSTMRHKILAVILGSACVVLLAIIGVVSCTTTSSNPDDDLSATVVDFDKRCRHQTASVWRYHPVPVFSRQHTAVQNNGHVHAAPMPLDMSVLYSCCSIRSG